MNEVKFYNLDKVNSKYKKSFISDFNKINSTGRYLIGNYVNKFERKLAKYCGEKYAIGVGNCVDAIKLSFMALKILKFLKDGDKVLVPANTYIASVIGIIAANLIPVPVDVDLDTYSLNIENLKNKITKKTKAILVADLFGHPANVKKINQIAKLYKLKIVNDAAQSFGGSYKNKMVGSLYDITCFSFFPGKNLGAFGDAGAVLTSSKKIKNIISSLRNYGEKPFFNLKDRKYVNYYIGTNSRLDELQASVLINKLTNFKKDQIKRKEIAEFYSKKIINEKVIKPLVKSDYHHSWHLYVIRCKQRDDLKKFLRNNKIQTMLHYPKPFYKQPAFKDYKFDKYPVTEKIYKEILSIPLHTALKKNEIQHIVDVINKF